MEQKQNQKLDLKPEDVRFKPNYVINILHINWLSIPIKTQGLSCWILKDLMAHWYKKCSLNIKVKISWK